MIIRGITCNDCHFTRDWLVKSVAQTRGLVEIVLKCTAIACTKEITLRMLPERWEIWKKIK